MDEIIAIERLLGQWSLFMSDEQPVSDGVFTMTLTQDGRMVDVIRDGEEVTVFNLEYVVSGDEITTTGPKEYLVPNRTRSKLFLDDAGNLIIKDGRIENRFKRI